MDTPNPEAPETKTSKPPTCKHALLINKDDHTTMPYWDCIYCGAVAFFDPGKSRMLVPRES